MGNTPAPPVHASRGRGVLLHLGKLAVGVAIVAYLLWQYDFMAVGARLRGTDPAWFAFAWVFALATMLANAAISRMAVRPLGMPFTTLQILKVNFQVRFYALFLPGAANFVVKWHKLARPAKQPGEALVLMGFSRLVHSLALLLVTATAIARDPSFPWPWMQYAAWLMAGLLVVAFCFVLSNAGRHTATRIGELPWISRFLPWFIASRWRKLWHTIARLQGVSRGELLLLVTLAFASNLLEILQHTCIGYAVGLELSFWVYAWLRGVVILCAILPISLAGLGIREASVVALLVFYAVPEDLALAFSLLFFSGFVIGKGLIGGVLEGMDFFRPGERPKA